MYANKHKHNQQLYSQHPSLQEARSQPLTQPQTAYHNHHNQHSYDTSINMHNSHDYNNPLILTITITIHITMPLCPIQHHQHHPHNVGYSQHNNGSVSSYYQYQDPNLLPKCHQ